MKWRYSIFLLLVFFLSACNPTTPAATAAPTATATGGPAAGTTPTTGALPTAVIRTTRVPEPKPAVEAFLAAWKKEDYPAMFAMISGANNTVATADEFAKIYTALARNLTLQSIDYQVQDGQWDAQTAKINVNVTYHTALFKDIQRPNAIDLALEQGAWKIKWYDGLPMPDLQGGKHLALDLTVPERGSILDRNGEVMAGNMNAVALGIIPGNIVSDQEDTLLSTLAALTGRVTQSIRQSYEKAGPDWYIRVGEVAKEDIGNKQELLNSLGGVQQYPYGPTRFYPWGGVAPHVTGHMQFISKEEQDRYLRMGYRLDEKVGATGLEAWGQDYLSGVRGATLDVVGANGQSTERLGQVAEQPAQNVYTTIDMGLQRQAQAAMRGYNGAVVVLERDTGRVLAMVSTPAFDPNYFDPNNYNANQAGGLTDLLNSQNTPLVNRATGDHGSGYPLGSVFKIIDMAAALEDGEFKVEDTYDCQYEFKDIVGRTYYDWTLEKDFPPSGLLNLPQGLMRSCDPWFYHIGLTLFKDGKSKDIATMARGFGLGSKTGIEGLPEIAGNVPEPENEVQAVEQAIGQDKLQVTPLQVADFIAAVGNGGTLYTPQIIEKIVDANGNETHVFQPKERGKLPISQDTLKVIQDAMRSVVANKRGTAYDRFIGFGIPTYGKTGTAQVDYGDPHAWFAAYTNEGNPDRPDVAVVVLCENTGEGADFAAPIARRVLEAYFIGHPVKVFPWEEKVNKYKEDTPTPEPGQEATPTP